MLRSSMRRLYNSTFKASEIIIDPSHKPVVLPPLDSLQFGHTFTNNMFEVAWDAQKGWKQPRICGMHDIALAPSASALHYAIQCFEGLKAYVDAQKCIRLFRPDMNAKRMKSSMERLGLAGFDENEWVECLKRYVLVEKQWIPAQKGYSLYLRPTAISTERTLGVSAPTTALLYTIASPVGPYYKTGFKPVSLLADKYHRRAVRGGVGAYKLGSNYGPTIQPMMEAQEKGYQQILWLDVDHVVTEVGTMNFFIFWKTKDGVKQLITCPLSQQTVLPGVTRDSVMTLAKSWGEFEVLEKAVTIEELIEAAQAGRVLECFGSGTAAIVSQVEKISYDGKDVKIPVGTDAKSSVAIRVWEELTAIQYGDKEHEWSVVVEQK